MTTIAAIEVRPRVMPFGRKVLLWQIGLVVGLVLLLEIASRMGWISPFTAPAPSKIWVSMLAQMSDVKFISATTQTMSRVAIAIACAVLLGCAIGHLLHALPRLRRLLEPLFASYYSVPFFVFYPVLVAIFGLGPFPVILIAILFAVVVMIVSTLDALDKIPKVFVKFAQTQNMQFIDRLLRINLPFVFPMLFSGFKLAVAYAVIAVLAAEFILSTSGLGYEISYSYNNFETEKMYGQIVLVLIFVGLINTSLLKWEGVLLARRGKSK